MPSLSIDDIESVEVLILDTATGQTFPGLDGMSPSWWLYSNGSCDCNRDAHKPYDDDIDPDHEDCSVRYLIVSVLPMPKDFTLYDFNSGYPFDLVSRFLPGPAETFDED